MSGVFVHAVVPASYEEPRSGTGPGEPTAEVRVVRTSALGALVSDLPDDRTPGTRADLQRHSGVLNEIVDRGVTVVPMRFGMVFAGDDAVRDRLLERHRERLGELLEQLGARVQITLKATYDEGVLLRDVAAADPRIARLSRATRDRPEAEVHAQKVQLGELVAQGVATRREADERAVLDGLGPVVERAIAEEPRHERVAVRAQLLVHRGRLRELDAAVGRLASEHEGRLTFHAVGPLPPWSFADVQLDDPEPAWA